MLQLLKCGLRIKNIMECSQSFQPNSTTSAICCLSSSAEPGMFSRLLRMALPSLLLVFFYLMALGIWTKLDSWQLMAAFTLSSSFSSLASLALSWFNSGSILEEEFFRLSISCANSLASCWPSKLHGQTDSSELFSPLGLDLRWWIKESELRWDLGTNYPW